MRSPGEKNPFQPEFIKIDYDVYTDPDLSPAAKLLLGRLMFYAGRNGKAFPKHETLAREICRSIRQVQTLLKELKSLNRIGWKRTRTSCLFEIKQRQEWKKASDLDRKEPSDLTGRKLPIKTGRKLPTEKKYRNHHQRRNYEKNEADPFAEALGSAEREPQKPKPKVFSSKVDDDEKPKPRTPLENPEMEFHERIKERHGTNVDSVGLLVDVKADLGPVPLSEFLEADLKATTAPGKLKNPHGHYRNVARKLQRKPIVDSRRRALEFILGPAPQKFTPSDCCNEGLTAAGSYCTCKVGTFKKQVDDSKLKCGVEDPPRAV